MALDVLVIAPPGPGEKRKAFRRQVAALGSGKRNGYSMMPQHFERNWHPALHLSWGLACRLFTNPSSQIGHP